MNAWTRKNLDALAAALETHLTTRAWNEQYGYLLIDARKRAHAASHVAQPDEKTLRELQAAVCSVCRQHHLYACDVPVGWSSKCALLKENS